MVEQNVFVPCNTIMKFSYVALSTGLVSLLRFEWTNFRLLQLLEKCNLTVYWICCCVFSLCVFHKSIVLAHFLLFDKVLLKFPRFLRCASPSVSIICAFPLHSPPSQLCLSYTGGARSDRLPRPNGSRALGRQRRKIAICLWRLDAGHLPTSQSLWNHRGSEQVCSLVWF